MTKIAKKTNNPILAYNTNMYLNNSENIENILREAGMEALAEISRNAFSG